jgi:sec-independent protein translocase protein TatA
MFGLSPQELLIVFLLIILLFGAKKLPELARSLGRSIKEFKHATQGLKDELDIDKIEEKAPRQTLKTEEKPQNTETPQSTQKANTEDIKS